MDDMILVICEYSGKSIDLLIPNDILADQLVSIVNETFRPSSSYETYAKSENPTRLVAGSIPVSALGLRNGSIIRL